MRSGPTKIKFKFKNVKDKIKVLPESSRRRIGRRYSRARNVVMGSNPIPRPKTYAGVAQRLSNVINNNPGADQLLQAQASAKKVD